MKLSKRIALTVVSQDDHVVTLRASIPAATGSLAFRTRTGALLRVDGAVAGAFDREHERIALAPTASVPQGERVVEIQVERASLPSSGLPSGDGPKWRLMRRSARQTPTHALRAGAGEPFATASGGPLALLAHSHLDVAWLWTYAETRRKALRTFATAVRQLDAEPSFIFVQSQPQLFAFVERGDAAFFGRVAELTRAGRIDASVAAMWVEPDCNIPSGESLLRQLAAGIRYAVEKLGTRPAIAWLPDTFGFPNTLPMLLRHAGVAAFATTKLEWNDTTRFEHPQFRWRAPDGSEVTSALLAAYGGDLAAGRRRTAAQRSEPLVCGYGDGGGGVTDEMLREAATLGTWTSAHAWFAELDRRKDALPVHQDELYLEFHRGVYTTHRDVKAGNASLERALMRAEELSAWCAAVKAPAAMLAGLRADLQSAWQIVLRNQFHDAIAGTSVQAVYDDVRAEYQRADAIVARTIASARSILPRGPERAQSRAVAPRSDGDEFVFENGVIAARVRRDGCVVELAANGTRSVATGANVLRAYVDKPARWEAWNLDRTYRKRTRKVVPRGCEAHEDGLSVRFTLGKSALAMQISLLENEPFLRVDLAIDWRERRTVVRCEHWLALDADVAQFGTPHGTIERTTRPVTAAEKAKFEVPGQRYVAVRDASGLGFAMLSPDTYGWNARALRNGGVQVGASLLRGTSWPDPSADLGTHHFSYALAPLDRTSTGALERAWFAYACEPEVRLFSCDDPAVSICAVKPADDGDGIVVRVRECDGASRAVRLACAGRVREVTCVDAVEESLDATVSLEAAVLLFELPAYALRSFRIRF